MYFFANPLIKLKLGLHIGGRLLIANQLDNHLVGQSEIVSISSIHIYYTLLWQMLGFAVSFTTLSKLRKEKTNLLNQTNTAKLKTCLGDNLGSLKYTLPFLAFGQDRLIHFLVPNSVP